jgi:methanogenic corrinoid protein MtbC1
MILSGFEVLDLGINASTNQYTAKNGKLEESVYIETSELLFFVM